MSVTSERSITLGFTGDVEYEQTFAATNVNTGSGQNQLQSLASGNNTITVPSAAVAVTIIPPVGNAVVLTLKGVNGDTGIVIHPSDPSSIGLSGVTSFVLNAASIVTVRLIFS